MAPVLIAIMFSAVALQIYKQDSLIRICAVSVFGKNLREKGPKLTFARLCTSAHLRDLQYIGNFTLIISVVIIGAALNFSIGNPSHGDNNEIFFKILSASAVVSTAAAILSWTYQTGSRRIGSVDLFAGEISVICRVCLIVDFARISVHLANLHLRIEELLELDHKGDYYEGKFVSQEEYTPVYDNNISDLQPLDVEVVTQVTSFYTYRKTMMDYLRLIAVTPDLQSAHELRTQMIYMQYLMYESARKSILLLIEFEPNQDENVINIMCSEVVLFSYLKSAYKKGDFRAQRLDLRVKDYYKLIRSLRNDIKKYEDDEKWTQAKTTLPELERRYREVCDKLELEFPE